MLTGEIVVILGDDAEFFQFELFAELLDEAGLARPAAAGNADDQWFHKGSQTAQK